MSTVVTTLVADSLLGLGFQISTDTSVEVTRPPTGAVDEVLVIFPGYAADGKTIGGAFAPHLRIGQGMIVLRYPQRGIDDQATYNVITDHLRQLSPRRLRILSGSMGAMVATRFLNLYVDDPERVRFDEIVLIMDTAPSEAGTIRRPQWMFSLSSWYRGGPISSACWAALSSFGASPIPEPDADQSIIRDGNTRNAWIGVPALTTQAAYIASFRAAEMSNLHDVVSRATYIQASSAQNDPLVRVDASIAAWRTALPGLTVSVIPTRDGSWHVPWTYRPRETLQIVNAA